MRRRELIAGITGAAVAWPLAVLAQQPALPVIGFLLPSDAEGYAVMTSGFRRGLAEAGYVEGQNVEIDYRWAEGHYERLPAMASDLVRRNVALIATAAIPAAFAAKGATQTVPIVFECGADPVRIGLVDSLNRPGGNITGIVNLSNALVVKRVEVLHEIVPNARTLALLLNPDNQSFQGLTEEARRAQTPLGINIEFLHARSATCGGSPSSAASRHASQQ
jgi:putative tryptophan/tyrosine transport system substrate-binding protein